MPSNVEEGTHDYRRESCDELIANDSSSEEDDTPVEEQDLLGHMNPEPLPEPDEDLALAEAPPAHPRPPKLSEAALRRRAAFTRYVALLCACCLSVGSHYASYILGPLKSQITRELGASHTEFSLLISAFSLNSTWTPLIGGILVSRLGTTFMSIVATGIIFLGQALLLLGNIWGNIRLMAFGMFVFGLGVSPLAVVQETIIVRFFKSHGLGMSLAFGLIAGKGASFVSARTSYPLTERFGHRAPFWVATGLAGLSVIVNLMYIAASRWLVDGAGAELEATDIKEEAQRRSAISISEARALEKVAAKRRVNFHDIAKLGDVFWAYVGLNVFCGAIWSPFLHLAANIIQTRYSLTEEGAANSASYLLAWSVFLYPIAGFLVDRFKQRPIVVLLMVISSSSTLLCFLWLALPPAWTHTPIPSIALFGFGHGFAPLLLVVIVPKIVSLKYVSTALGVHKSLEQTGSTIFQTLAGLALDIRKGKDLAPGRNSKTAVQHLLDFFVLLNVLQLLSIFSLVYLQRKKNDAVTREISRRSSTFSFSPGTGRSPSPSPDPTKSTASRLSLDGSAAQPSGFNTEREQERRPLLSVNGGRHRRYSTRSTSRSRKAYRDEATLKSELRRGKAFMATSIGLIVFAWALFLGTAWFRLGRHRKKD